jgi:formylglycine-generating enzyme required for sulfatase activity
MSRSVSDSDSAQPRRSRVWLWVTLAVVAVLLAAGGIVARVLFLRSVSSLAGVVSPSVAHAALEGDPSASRAVANVYLERGDIPSAGHWFAAAAESGDPPALCSYGIFRWFFSGKESDVEDAVKTLTESTEAGNPHAPATLALAYLTGVGTDRDIARAKELFQTAASRGNSAAAGSLAALSGSLTEEDAQTYLALAAARARPASAMTALGIAFAVGDGVAQDARKSVACLRRASEMGDAEGQYELSQALAETSPRESASWLRKSAMQGFVGAEERLGKECLDAGDWGGARNWYSIAAEQGSDEAAYRYGVVLSRDDAEKGMDWIVKAARNGHPEAQWRMGCYCRERGEIEGARAWFTLAEEQGQEEAREALADLPASEESRADARARLEMALSVSEEARRVEGKAKVENALAGGGIELPGGVRLPMVDIRAGTFYAQDPASSEDQGRWVTLTRDYYIAKTEITQDQWHAVMGTRLSEYAPPPTETEPLRGEGDAYPMFYVSWADAVAFCEKLNAMGAAPEWYRFRLPTEAEWEYACRAGTTGPYAGNLDEMAWYDERWKDGSPHPVAEKRANAWGLNDMHGNVYEWCQDWYGEIAGLASVTNPVGPKTGTHRVARGGSWNLTAPYCRSGARFQYVPAASDDALGFRVVLIERHSSH